MGRYCFEAKQFKGGMKKFTREMEGVAGELFKLQGKGKGTEVISGITKESRGYLHTLGIQSTFIPGMEIFYERTDLEMEGGKTCPEEVRLGIKILSDEVRSSVLARLGNEFGSDIRTSGMQGYDLDSFEIYASGEESGLIADFKDEHGDNSRTMRKVVHRKDEEGHNTIAPIIFEEIWKGIRRLIEALYLDQKDTISPSHSSPDFEACPDRSLVGLLIGKLRSVRG